MSVPRCTIAFSFRHTDADRSAPNRRRRMCGRAATQSTLLLAATSILASPRGVSSTANFCGRDWGDASSDCENRQPCPMGTDAECTHGGICWADTECNTASGHGILFDTQHPQHSRFCGKSWNDANDNCSLERHCPSGDSSECPGSEECYSFLGDCNYVDLIGGPPAAGSSSGGDGGDSNKLPNNDPSRSNFCGWDWNDALTNCSEDDHWCPSGADADCPDGKTCFAGTECKYVSDLFPTQSPTFKPSGAPTPSPIKYETEENTRFCGEGWEDARTTCRIGSHCPSGSNSDCPGSQVCFSWIKGCNIIDFRQYLDENGEEIFGADHWLLPEEGLAVEDVGSGSTPQLPPSDLLLPTPARQPSGQDIGRFEESQPTGQGTGLYVPTHTNPPTPKPVSTKPTVFDPNRYDPNNHIFCGKTWQDAMDRCSPETFCTGGASHRCVNATDYCWVGVSACNGGEYRPTLAPTPEPTRPVTAFPTKEATPPPTPLPTPPLASDNSSASQGTETVTIRDSYCAKTYLDLIQNCANLQTCGSSNSCPDRYTCFSNVKCTVAAPKPAVSSPVPPPVTNTPVSEPPTAPFTYMPTYSPTIYTLSDEEIASRLTNMQNYCASSFAEVMSSCASSLRTCNPGEMCPPGTNCFENIVCPDSALTDAPATSEPTPSPTKRPTPKPVSAFEDMGSSVAVVPMGQNYCATTLQELQSTCATAPTCNDGDGPCPSGTFCFGNHKCNQQPATEPPVVTSAPTPPPTMKPTPAPVEPASGDGNSNATPQNYCLTKDGIEATCASAQTCNDGDGPCPPNTFCFVNIVCPNQSSSTDDAPVTPAPTPKPTLRPIVAPVPESLGKPAANDDTAQMQTPTDEISAENPATIDSVCSELCLQPIAYSDCEFALNAGMGILSCTSPDVEIGDLCAATGECGTDVGLDNCPGNLDMYMRLNPFSCVEQGFFDGAGVIPFSVADPEGDESVSGRDPSDIPIFGFGGLQENETATETPANSASNSNAEDDTDPWKSWEEDTGANSQFDLGDWWIKNSATDKAWMACQQVLAMAALVVFAVL